MVALLPVTLTEPSSSHIIGVGAAQYIVVFDIHRNHLYSHLHS